MKKQIFAYYLVFAQSFAAILLTTLISSCAQVVAPGGGPIDEAAPQTLKYSPDSASTRFNSKSVIISFDEYIQLTDLQSQLIISPPLKKQPEIKVKEKDLLITFSESDTLKPNTTYVINFGSALRDLNEGNTKDGFRYVFSTGDYIDSLVVSGKVWDAFNHKTEKGILVMLYEVNDDSVIFKQTPEYFTKTKEDGSFTITNVHEGTYKLMALKDNNSNYKYDDETEKIAFVDSLISTSSSNNLLLEMFNEPPKKFFFNKYIYNSYGKINFYFNKGSDSIKVIPINHHFDDADVLLDYSENKDTLTYWFRNIEKDSLILQLSNGATILDTIELKLITKEEALKDKKNPLAFKMISSPDGNMNFDLGNYLNIKFATPVNHDLYKGIMVSEDSILWKQDVFSNIWEHNYYELGISEGWDSTNTVEDPMNLGVFIQAPTKSAFNNWKFNTKYDLFISPGTITDFFGFTNDSINIHFKTREETYYGTLKINVNVPATKGSYIVQLLDEKENVIKELTIEKSEVIDYKYLQPKTYKLKIIYNTNNNWNWDSGNLSKKLQPEKVIYNTEPIKIRSNWDLETIWDVK